MRRRRPEPPGTEPKSRPRGTSVAPNLLGPRGTAMSAASKRTRRPRRSAPDGRVEAHPTAASPDLENGPETTLEDLRLSSTAHGT
jgi:hypothetical protein